MSTKNENEEQNQNLAEEAGEEREERTKSRTRAVDFMRVEDTQGQTLTHFELKVKEKIACVPSPFEELARKEDEENRSEEVRNTLRDLVEKALTEKQKAWFHLAYVEELPDFEIAKRLGVTKRRVSSLRAEALNAFKRVYEKERLKQYLDTCALTEKQRLVIELRFEKRLSYKEIAERLGVTVWAVDDVLKRIRKNFFSRENS